MSVAWSDFHGANLALALDLYEQYRRDPASVDPATRALFEQLPDPAQPTPGVERAQGAQPAPGVDLAFPAAIGAFNYIRSLRQYGHLAADIDPLGTRPQGDPTLELATHCVSDRELEALPASLVPSPAVSAGATLADLAHRLREIYCGSIGFDLAHIFVPEERRWLREAIESQRFVRVD